MGTYKELDELGSILPVRHGINEAVVITGTDVEADSHLAGIQGSEKRILQLPVNEAFRS